MRRYVLVEHLHDGAVFSLDRALDGEDGGAVVLKRLPAGRSEPSERARLRREYELLRRLELPGVVQARSLEEEAGELRLVLTDVGGDSLDVRLRRGRLPLAEFLDLALQLADIVDRVHRRGVLHKDIKPRNILVDPAGRVQLIDFGIASEAPRELAVADPPQVLEGTLAYIAPEQTGRMNRPIDARSDLYSLGATLYEMLTGRPPFLSTDPVELVHCHIARAPVPPSELDPEIPPVLSDMVLRLLAKQADDRYQSALGLHHDLAVCRERLREGAPIERFPLASHDVPARFELPARLYGREAAIAALVAALARVRVGGCELVCVAGPPGIGKTAVIGELGREVAACGGRLIAGKFDHLARDRPYSAVREALGQLVEAILAEPEAALARRRTALQRSLGRLRGALLELLPELGAVLERPAAAGAGEGDSPGAVRGRVQRAVRAFVGAFAEPTAPLVLLLDDLQWADAASLELLGALLGPERPPGLLVVATVREGAPTPALHDLLAGLEQAGVLAARIDLAPLTEADTRALVADAMRCAPAEAAPLAALVHDRTGGVPLLVGEYLRDLVGHGLVSLDLERRRWRWDDAAIAGAAVSADVVSRMVERTRSIGQAPRDALARAACLGGEFDAATLAGLFGRAEDEVAAALAVAARSGLIVAVGGRYRFFHDRVQQAVASTLGDPERQAIHLAIARGLAGARVDDDDPRLFEVVHHFNLAAPQIDDPGERRRLAALDLAAARRARASGAFAAVAAYAAAGAGFLDPSADPALRFELELLRAEGLFLSGEHAAAEAVLKDLLERSRDPRERARACELWAALDLHVGRLAACVEHGRVGLAALGIDVPRRVGIPGVMIEYLRTRAALGGRTDAQLLALPRLVDPRIRLVLRLIFVTLGGAFQLDPLLTTAITMRALRLSLEHGVSSLTAAQLVSYGLMVGLVDRDVAGMERYGQLGLAALERHPDRGVEAVVKFLYGAMIQPWSHPLARTVPVLREAIQAGLDSGQLIYAGISAMAITSNRLLGGTPLEQLRQELEGGLALARETRLTSVLEQSAGMAAALGALTGVPLAVGQSPVREDMITPVARDVWDAGAELVLGRFDAGLAASDRADGTAERALGQTLLYADHVFVRAMLQATRDALPGPLGGARLRRVVEQAARRLERWAAGSPANFEARGRLLRAELARLAGDGAAALRGYEESVTLAVRDGRPQDEGLACEAAARFFAAAGADEAARLYLRRARRAYLRWGALAKVEQLDRLHPGLERRADVDVRDSSQPGRAESATTRVVHLDFAALFKATQVFAEELALDRLLASVMRIVVESAGAERGVLLLARAGGLVGARAYTAAGDAHVDLREAPLAALGDVPAGVVLLAHRGGRPVVVDDATRDPRFDGDRYVADVRPRSLLAAPLIRGGEHLGVVYLENNLAAGVFTPARAEGLHLLAVQAAIAIDRAMLFGRIDEARRAAEAASVAKTRFLANMSHELRTPLNAILGYCELLAEEAEERGHADMRADLDKIQRAGAHLLAIVRDILDLTKIESGRLEPTREAIDLGALLDDVVAVIAPEIQRNHNRLVRAWPGDLGVLVSDPTLLRQVLLNLLGNAAKFTRRGEITLRAERLAGGSRVRFTVVDTGIGMTADELAVVFEPFIQADNSPTRRYGGVGLGLTITRRIVEALGGAIEVHSERGRGSTFAVELSVGPVA